MFERAKKGWRPPKPEKKRINFMVSEAVLTEFEEYCKKNSYKRSELIECILEEFLKKYGKK